MEPSESSIPDVACPEQVRSHPDWSLDSYDYALPPDQIAQTPAVPRDSSRLLVVGAAAPRHQRFWDLPDLLQPGDLLVVNNTRVIPARLLGQKLSPTGAAGVAVEVFLLESLEQNRWLALVKPGRRLPPGAEIVFGNPPELRATVLNRDEGTRGRVLQFHLPPGEVFDTYLQRLGAVPLPPYIQDTAAQPEQYQTVYAERPGAVAAPTAGLHFTPEVFDRLADRGIHCASVTLHVGIGTFRPVEISDITTHTMHEEWVEVPAETVERIRQTQQQGGRVIAVGTTVVRSLEGAAVSGTLQPYQGKVNLFIYPGYRWRVVEGLITNFHLPRSSLLMLVSALVGRERLLALYETAIAAGYRFYSFGDAMLILPEARLSNE